MKQTAVVIGAGIGGIATAARLAKNGYDVTVLEKNATPAGAAIRSSATDTASILARPCFSCPKFGRKPLPLSAKR
jgi:glycine/D-amino acid oxidase-like deaminating enzyme